MSLQNFSVFATPIVYISKVLSNHNPHLHFAQRSDNLLWTQSLCRTFLHPFVHSHQIHGSCPFLTCPCGQSQSPYGPSTYFPYHHLQLRDTLGKREGNVSFSKTDFRSAMAPQSLIKYQYYVKHVFVVCFFMLIPTNPTRMT